MASGCPASGCPGGPMATSRRPGCSSRRYATASSGERALDTSRQHNTRAVPLSRIAWLLTVAVAVITGVILLIDGYTGYGVLSFVVGAAAAINLR